jgi:hypothetical protein
LTCALDNGRLDRHAQAPNQDLFFLVLLVATSVFGREIPECLNLSNDVSNDGAVAISMQKGLMEIISLRRHSEGLLPLVLAPLPQQQFGTARSSASPRRDQVGRKTFHSGWSSFKENEPFGQAHSFFGPRPAEKGVVLETRTPPGSGLAGTAIL